MPLCSTVLGSGKNKRLNRMESLSILKNLTDSMEKAVPQFNSLFIPIPALLRLD